MLGFWVAVVSGIVVTRYVVDLGDSGLTNVATMVFVAIGLLVSVPWLVWRSGLPARARFWIGLVVVATVVLAAALLRVEGFDGQMLPILAARFGAGATSLAFAPATGDSTIVLTSTVHDFPAFLGPRGDLRVDNVNLATAWDARAPELLWRQPIGAGWSAFAVVNGNAATLEQRDGREFVTLYDVASGALLWAHEIGASFTHTLGGSGPRSTPTIDDGVVYATSVHGQVVAVRGSTGEMLWQHNLLAEYGVSAAEEAEDVAYGRSASPLVLGDRVIVAVGGSRRRRVTLAAYDKRTGALLWEGGERNVSMASPSVGTLLGRETILSVNENWVSGHEAETGETLWEFEWPSITAADAANSQAVAVGGDRVFVSKGYGLGAALYQLSAGSDGAVQVQQVWHQARSLRTKLTNVAIKGGYVYGLSEGILECVELESGDRAWKAGRYHHGQILMVGELLLVLTEDGEVVLVEATPERKNNVLGRFQALEGHTWNNLALFGDILLVRNGQQAAAYRLPLAGGD